MATYVYVACVWTRHNIKIVRFKWRLILIIIINNWCNWWLPHVVVQLILRRLNTVHNQTLQKTGVWSVKLIIIGLQII